MEDGSELELMRERRRLASELHASVAQTLFGIGVEAGVALEQADERARERALRAIAELASRARRELYGTLAALNRKPAPLRAWLDGEIAAFEQATGIVSTVACSGPVRPLPPLAEDLLRDAFAEALRNVRKHAVGVDRRPSQLRAELTCGEHAVELRVRDDGAASAAQPRRARAGRPGGYLDLLSERAEELGGRLELELPERGGALLRLRLPIAAAGGEHRT